MTEPKREPMSDKRLEELAAIATYGAGTAKSRELIAEIRRLRAIVDQDWEAAYEEQIRELRKKDDHLLLDNIQEGRIVTEVQKREIAGLRARIAELEGKRDGLPSDE